MAVAFGCFFSPCDGFCVHFFHSLVVLKNPKMSF